MDKTGHLWALGYADMSRADQVRDYFKRLGEKHCLILLDTAVAVRYLDGSLTLDGEPFVAVAPRHDHTFASFLASLALAAPLLTGAAVSNVMRARASPRPRSGSTRTSSARWRGWLSRGLPPCSSWIGKAIWMRSWRGYEALAGPY